MEEDNSATSTPSRSRKDGHRSKKKDERSEDDKRASPKRDSNKRSREGDRRGRDHSRGRRSASRSPSPYYRRHRYSRRSHSRGRHRSRSPRISRRRSHSPYFRRHHRTRRRSHSRGRRRSRSGTRSLSSSRSRSRSRSHSPKSQTSSSQNVSAPPTKEQQQQQQQNLEQERTLALLLAMEAQRQQQALAMAMDPQRARQARRLYVGNIPPGITDLVLLEAINAAMMSSGLVQTRGNPAISCQINHEKSYAFLEFNTPEEASAGMSLDGITLMGHALKIRRPKDYIGTDTAPAAPAFLPNVVATRVVDGPNKIFLGGLPTVLDEIAVRELLQSFGQLKAFNLVKDSTTGKSKGYAFCEFLDSTLTDVVCTALNGLKIMEKTLQVQRASLGAKPTLATGLPGLPGSNPLMTPFMAAVPSPLQQATLLPQVFNLSSSLPSVPAQVATVGGTTSSALALSSSCAASSDGTITRGERLEQPHRILVLGNMCSPTELEDSEAYEDLIEDARGACSEHGTVLSVKVPRPQPHDPQPPGLGLVFVEFADSVAAAAAKSALGGRWFAGRLVSAAFYPEEAFQNNNLGDAAVVQEIGAAETNVHETSV